MLLDLARYTAYISAGLITCSLVAITVPGPNRLARSVISFITITFLVVLTPAYTRAQFLTAIGVGVAAGFILNRRFDGAPEISTVGIALFGSTLIGGLTYAVLTFTSNISFYLWPPRLNWFLQTCGIMFAILFVLQLFALWLRKSKGYKWASGGVSAFFVLLFVNAVIAIPILLAVWLGSVAGPKHRLCPVAKTNGVASTLIAVGSVTLVAYFGWMTMLFLTPQNTYIGGISPFLALLFCFPAFFGYSHILKWACEQIKD